MELLQTLSETIGAAVGTIVALGGLVAAIGRLSRATRLRRRMTASATMAKEAHPSHRARFDALHREDTARYLALVRGRTAKAGWPIPVAIGIAALSVLILLLTACSLGAGIATWEWDDSAGVLAMFAILGFCAIGFALREGAKGRQGFIALYREYAALPE